jgi:hypothetical protein
LAVWNRKEPILARDRVFWVVADLTCDYCFSLLISHKLVVLKSTDKVTILKTFVEIRRPYGGMEMERVLKGREYVQFKPKVGNSLCPPLGPYGFQKKKEKEFKFR